MNASPLAELSPADLACVSGGESVYDQDGGDELYADPGPEVFQYDLPSPQVPSDLPRYWPMP